MKQKIDTPINVGIDTSLSQLHIYIRPLDECFLVSNDTPVFKKPSVELNP